MTCTLALDVYGTLFDVGGISRIVPSATAERASRLCDAWRQKQLEYLFRRDLMGKYESFSTCTKQALE